MFQPSMTKRQHTMMTDFDFEGAALKEEQLLVKRKASAFTHFNLNPYNYPYNLIREKVQVRSLLSKMNRKRW